MSRRWMISLVAVSTLISTLLLRWLFPSEAMEPIALDEVEGSWTVSVINDDPVVVGTNTTELPVFELMNGEINGSLGCGRFSARYSLTDDQLVFTELTTDQIGCETGTEQDPSLLVTQQTLTAVLVEGDEVRVIRASAGPVWLNNGYELQLSR